MDSEDRCDEGAGPKGIGHSPQQYKEQTSRDSVQHEIRGVVPPGIETKELAIDHVRNPGHRMPVERVGSQKGPQYAAESQAAQHKRILINIIGIVEVHEAVEHSLAKNEINAQQEHAADEEILCSD